MDQRQLTTLCFVLRDNKLLLLERMNTWYENGKYLPPGGNVDAGEDPKLAAVRELFEETNVVAEPDSLELIHEYPSEFNDKHFYSYYYITENSSGELENKEPDRHSDLGWFPLDALPENTSDIVFDILKKYVRSR